MEERLVYFRPRVVLVVLGLVLAAAASLAFLYFAWRVVTWILIALFLALALNPAVEWFQRRGLGRGWASFVVFMLALFGFAGLVAVVIPPLVDQIETFIAAIPDLVEDLLEGRGRLGFLQEDYQLVDELRQAIESQGTAGVLGVTSAGIAIARGVISFVVGTVAIAFITFFMLLEGPRIVARFRELLPETIRPRWERVSGEIYRTVGGYVSGNLLISLIAGVVSAVVLFALGSDYAVALAIVVAVLDLVPLAGATVAAVIVSTVGFIELGWARGLILVVFFILYQQLENHILQPIIYGRTVQLSPLTVLVAVLIGAELIGILGALAAIPTAGVIQAIFREVLLWRREAVEATPGGVALPEQPPP